MNYASKFDIYGQEVYVKEDKGLTIFIGDSYTVGGLATNLANVLKLDADNYYTFAKTGAGYVRPDPVDNKVFYTLCTEASSGVESNLHERVLTIFMLGGLNDMNPLQAEGTVNTEVARCINFLKTAFPNATVYTGVPYHAATITHARYDIINAVAQASLVNNARYLPHLYLALLGRNALISSDGVHPTSEGYIYLANYIWSVLNNVPDFSYDYYQINTAEATGWMGCVRQGGYTSVYGKVTPLSGYATIIDLNNTPYVGAATIGTIVSYGTPLMTASLFLTGGGTVVMQGVTPNTPYTFSLTTISGINEF